MASVEEIFREGGRRLRGVEAGDPGSIDRLESLLGRPLPRELRAYLRLAGGDPGNLRFVQTHKIIRPTLREALDRHTPRRHGRRENPEKPASKIHFGDGEGCQDCGPAVLIVARPRELPDLEIDPEDPPVAGYDYDELVILNPRFTGYVLAAMPAKPPR